MLEIPDAASTVAEAKGHRRPNLPAASAWSALQQIVEGATKRTESRNPKGKVRRRKEEAKRLNEAPTGQERIQIVQTLILKATKALGFAEQLSLAQAIARCQLTAQESRTSDLLNWVHARAAVQSVPLPLRSLCLQVLKGWTEDQS